MLRRRGMIAWGIPCGSRRGRGGCGDWGIESLRMNREGAMARRRTRREYRSVKFSDGTACRDDQSWEGARVSRDAGAGGGFVFRFVGACWDGRGGGDGAYVSGQRLFEGGALC